MKKLISTSFKLFLVVLLFPFIAKAQKLPNVQEKSLRAPASIKVDGKPTEWNKQFQAYNKATEIFYTISNDNDKLYLTVQATDLDIINKIICAGITLTVNGAGKMKDQEGTAITFPVLNENSFPREYSGSAYPSIPINLDKPETMQADSFMVILNKQLTLKLKDIKVTGVKEIPDPLISIYNPEGIKAVALFDDKTIFTYELAVPLKYLVLSLNNPQSFVYNIKLNGMNPTDGEAAFAALRVQRVIMKKGISDIFTSNSGNGKIHIDPKSFRKDLPFIKIDIKDGTFSIVGDNAQRLVNLISPTDFWGEYTLAK